MFIYKSDVWSCEGQCFGYCAHARRLCSGAEKETALFQSRGFVVVFDARLSWKPAFLFAAFTVPMDAGYKLANWLLTSFHWSM